ncbi:MAG: sigma-E factor regulatory protein RseB domain-containing protein [Frankiaceae bacterium]
MRGVKAPRLPSVPGRVAWLVALAALGAVVLPGSVATAKVASGVPETNVDAFNLLIQGARAERELAYSGQQKVVVYGHASTRACLVAVRHEPGDGVTVTVVKPELSGVSSTSAGITAVHERDERLPAGTLLQLGAGTMKALATNYSVTMLGPGAVAGRAVQGVELHRREGGRGAVVWLDAVTSLPLQREIYRVDGSLAASSAYTSVSYRSASHTAVPYTEPALGRTYPADEVGELRAAGWQVPEAFPGGQQLFDAHLQGSGAAALLQLTYSDGLSALSVFEQPGTLNQTALSGWQRSTRGGGRVWGGPGLPEQVAWSAGGYVYTVVADDPGQVDAVVATLPHSHAEDGVWDRIGRGLRRVGSWFNPFE